MRSIRLIVSTLALAALPLMAQPQTAKPASPEVTEGIRLLKAGDLSGSLKSFRLAAEKDPTDARARKAMASLTRAVMLGKLLANEKHPKWAAAALWLQKFYTVNKLPRLNLELAAKAHKKFPQDKSWGLKYADALTRTGKAGKALAIYKGIVRKTKCPETSALAAILLARMNEDDQAQEYLCSTPKEYESQGFCYNVACALSILGETDRAAHCLGRAFELTPPSRLAGMKKQAQADKDLENLHDTTEWKVALKAVSKVGEPAKGACATCPSKGSCGSSGGGDCGSGGCETPPKKAPVKTGKVKGR